MSWEKLLFCSSKRFSQLAFVFLPLYFILRKPKLLPRVAPEPKKEGESLTT